jgi:excisionase family DNA binding protein
MPVAERALVMTVPEAGTLLGLSRAAAYQAAARGDIPAVRIGRLLKVPKVALDRMLAEAGVAKKSTAEGRLPAK